MVLNQREKYIVIGVASVVCLYVMDTLFSSKYWTPRVKAIQDTAEVKNNLDRATQTFAREKRFREIWADIQRNGLKVEYTDAESQALKAMIDLALESRVQIIALKQERPQLVGKFEIIGYHCQASGSMRQLSHFFWALETAPIPLRVNDVQITPLGKEGLDEVSVQMSISTICMPPELEKNKTTVSFAERN